MNGKAAKDKGSRAEREVITLYQFLLGINPRRTLAGHREDIGDLAGVTQTTVQIKNYVDIARAIREGLADLKAQQERSGDPYGVLWVRLPGGRYIVVQTPEQHARLWREATQHEVTT